MSYGGWKEERDFDFPADPVFEHLLGVLQHVGLRIEKADAALRGVVASQDVTWSFWAGMMAGRVAAAVDPIDASRSRVTIECAPAYDPGMFAEGHFRKHTQKLLDFLQRSLDS